MTRCLWIVPSKVILIGQQLSRSDKIPIRALLLSVPCYSLLVYVEHTATLRFSTITYTREYIHRFSISKCHEIAVFSRPTLIPAVVERPQLRCELSQVGCRSERRVGRGRRPNPGRDRQGLLDYVIQNTMNKKLLAVM